VDDFEKLGGHNRLGGDSGAFSDPEGRGGCYVFPHTRAEQVFGEKGTSLYIQWDTAKQGAYAGYWTNLNHLNVEGFNYLTFYVKGMQGGEKFKIGLRGKFEETYETKILVEEALKMGVSQEWKKVVLPLKWFKAVEDWKDVTIFSINFEHAFGSGRGAVLLDEIAFEK
jgi:hypothetical protein